MKTTNRQNFPDRFFSRSISAIICNSFGGKKKKFPPQKNSFFELPAFLLQLSSHTLIFFFHIKAYLLGLSPESAWI